jgi:hypothetical protein
MERENEKMLLLMWSRAIIAQILYPHQSVLGYRVGCLGHTKIRSSDTVILNGSCVNEDIFLYSIRLILSISFSRSLDLSMIDKEVCPFFFYGA